MQRWTTPQALREACDQARSRGERVGLVPTMGALHQGHLALIAEARTRASFVAVTLFVNPTQFGPNEDFTRYPRTIEADLQACQAAGASGVFTPAVDDMYPAGEETRVRVGATAEPLDGVHRPGHFEGVATIVAKLFALAGPCTAIFGRKDYQQLQVLKRMARDLFLPVELVGFPTVREPDGLALSSRNAYLSPSERTRALSLSAGLRAAQRAFASGEREASKLEALARASLDGAVDRIDYVSVAHADHLAPFEPGAVAGERALLAIAARVGTTRLIDNVVLGEDAPLPELDLHGPLHS